MNVSINNLVIEITQKCNMQCYHCLRGAARRNNTSRVMINRIFDLFNGYILNLTVSGGEPSMNIDALEDICDNMIRSDNVHSVYIVTNGRVYKEKFLDKVYNLFNAVCYDDGCYDDGCYDDGCYDNGTSMLAFSFDRYHDACLDSNEIKKRNLNYCRTIEYFEDRGVCDVVRKHTDRTKSHDLNIVAMGRAANFGTEILKPKMIEYEIQGGELRIEEPELYINHKGYIFSSCDLSYEEMTKRSKFYVGDIHNMKDHYDFLKAVKFYNKKTAMAISQDKL